MQREKRRRKQHRQRHHHHQQLRGVRGEYAQACRRGEQHEGELAALGERRRQPLRGLIGRSARARNRVHEDELRGHQPKRQSEYRDGLPPGETEIGAHTHGDEEQPEQQALERLDVRLEFVAELRVGEQDAREEGAERHRQADFLHDQRGADDEEQRRRGEHLAPAVARGQLEHGAHQQPAARDHRDYHGYPLERGYPVAAGMHSV